MNADRLAEIRTRHRQIDPEIAAQWTDGWSGWYLADVGALLAALGEARGCCPKCDAPYGDVHKTDCTHMLDRMKAVGIAQADPEGDEEEEDDIHTPHPHGPDIGTVDRMLTIENVGDGTITLVGQGGDPSIELRPGEVGRLQTEPVCTCNRNVALYGHKPDCPAGGGT